MTNETNFRDGNTNLHFVHVKGEPQIDKYGIRRASKKGRACFGCHMSHESNQPFMLLEKLESGKQVIYSLNFTKHQNGGKCFVGCHKPRDYDRGVMLPKDEQISLP